MSADMTDQRGSVLRNKAMAGRLHDGDTIVAATRQPGDSRLVEISRNILKSRLMLGGLLEASLFANPGLDIMLFLFAEGVDGATVTTNACCLAAGVPRTTALRWIKLLQDRGLIHGSDDVNDRRVTMLALTPTARETIRAWLTALARLPTPANPVDH